MLLFLGVEAQEPIYGHFVVFSKKKLLPKNESSFQKHCWYEHKNIKNYQTNMAAHLDDACSTIVLESVTWRPTSHLTGDYILY